MADRTVQDVIEAQPNLFTPFARVSAEELPLYAPEDNEEALQTLLMAKMAEHNETNAAMNLVLFQQAGLFKHTRLTICS